MPKVSRFNSSGGISDGQNLSNKAPALVERTVIVNVATVDSEGPPQLMPGWIDLDGDDLVFNTARGRANATNLTNITSVAISIVAPDDPRSVVVVRGSVKGTEEGDDAHIDTVAKKYLDVDTYSIRQPGEARVISQVHAVTVAMQSNDA